MDCKISCLYMSFLNTLSCMILLYGHAWLRTRLATIVHNVNKLSLKKELEKSNAKIEKQVIWSRARCFARPASSCVISSQRIGRFRKAPTDWQQASSKQRTNYSHCKKLYNVGKKRYRIFAIRISYHTAISVRSFAAW